MDPWTAIADEHGVIALADLRRASLDVRGIERLTKTGELTRLSRGWYAAGTPDSHEEHHRLATRAMLRAHGDRAVAAYHSALVLHGLPTYQARLGTVRLSRVRPGPPRTRPGLSMGRAVRPEAIRAPTVTPAMAIAQVSSSSGPLASLIAADAALRRKLVTPADLRQAALWVEKHPHTARLESFLDLADGRRESPGETRLGHAFHLLGVAVTPQVRVEDGAFLAFLDFLLDDWPVVFEFDGKMKYGRAQDRVDNRGRPISAGDAVWCEKQREDHLRRLGYEVVRVVWSELDDLAELDRRRHAAISRARARGRDRRPPTPLTQSRRT